jgi:glycosyltransferase involved in cell wall biosynthesis
VVHHAVNPGRRSTDGYEVFRLPEHPARGRGDLYFHSRGDEPVGFGEFLDRWRPDVVHFHALTLGAGLDHSRAVKRRGLPYLITYHTPTFSCQRGTLMLWGKEVCDGAMRPQRCAACTLHGQGVPRPLAALLALSPLSWDWLPDGPWIPRLALPSLLAERFNGWREWMRGATRIVACANWCRELLIANGVPAERIGVHRQALPGEDRTRRLRLPLGGHRPLRLGFFGRFAWVKGPDIFLAGLRRLRDRGVPAVGELVGPLAERERAWAERLLPSAHGQDSYLGVKREAGLTDWLDTLDLVVIPSRWLETGPLTLLEAWDRGVPVVGTELGGIPEFMYPAGMGSLLFAPENPDALADAVLRAVHWPGPDLPEVAVNGMAELGRQMESLYRAVA